MTPREQAAEKLRIRAERLRAIRRRVWAGALATFAIAFGVIGVSGSMGSQTATPVAQSDSSTSTASGDDQTFGDDETFGDESGDSNGSSGSSSAGTPMTTRQS